MKLAYQAIGKNGAMVHDVTDARDSAEAVENLRRQGMFVTEIAPASETVSKKI